MSSEVVVVEMLIGEIVVRNRFAPVRNGSWHVLPPADFAATRMLEWTWVVIEFATTAARGVTMPTDDFQTDPPQPPAPPHATEIGDIRC
jgi:hypothetical protein